MDKGSPLLETALTPSYFDHQEGEKRGKIIIDPAPTDAATSNVS
jgi:hypothetical protein